MSYFDASEVEEKLGGYGPIPRGVYSMCVEECVENEDKHGNPYIKLMMTVTEGPHRNRKLFNNLYLNHPEWEGAVKNGRATLKALCEVIGLKTLRGPRDLANFIGMECDVDLGVYKDKNIINGIKGKAVPVKNMDDVPL